MRKKDLLKQSKKLAAVVTAAAMLESSVVPAAAADSLNTDVVQAQVEEAQNDSEEIVPEDTVHNSDSSDGESGQNGETPEASDDSEKSVEEDGADEEQPEEAVTDGEQSEETEETVVDEEQSEETEETVTDGEQSGETGETVTDGEQSEETEETVTDEEQLEDTEKDSEDETEDLSAEKNGWIQDENGNWNYYEDGSKYVDQVVYETDEETGETKIYRLDKDGNRLDSSWYEDSNGYKYYYDENGCQVKGTYKIDGNLYFFFSDGVRADAGSSFSEYDRNTGTYKWYRTDENGCLYTGWYSKDGDYWYYYGSDGVQAEGLTEVDGVFYYFDEYKKTSQYIIEDGYFYYFGADGALQVRQSIDVDGWLNCDENTYYMKDGKIARNQFITADGHTCYMGYDGQMYKDRTFEKYENGIYYNYRADKDGYLVTGWYTDQYENRYYYDTDGKGVTGIVTVDGDTYYFGSDSEIWCDYTTIEGGYYYYFGEDGKLEVKKDLSTDGWINTSQGQYYVKDGDLVRDQFLTVDGYIYYMSSSGCVYKDGRFSKYDKETGKTYTYYADQDGHLLTGWHQDEDDEMYYYGPDGRAANGVTEVEGETYYFVNGRTRTCFMTTQDGMLYYFDEDGKATVKKDLNEDGWVEAGQDQYYVKDGALVKDQFIAIDGYIYYMNYDGTMRKDGNFSVYDSETGTSYTYCAEKDGRLVTGWYTNEYNSTYYYDKNGRGAEGVTTIDGATYYFSNGRMVTDYTTIQNGYLYYFGKDGKQEVKKDLSEDGWVEYKGNKFYVKDGELVKNQFVTDGGYTYYMDYNGRMSSSQYFWSYNEEEQREYRYYVDKDGHVVTGWRQDGNKRFYFDKDGRGAEGIVTIDGKTYYFSDAEMQTNYTLEKSGYLYYFGSDGTQTVKKDLQEDGWVQIADQWLYVKSGSLVKNEFVTNGNYTYYFDDDGYMCKDQQIGIWDDETEEEYYYCFDAKGHMVTGWYTDEYEDVYYYGSDGRNASGVTVIDGKTYCFDYEGMMRRNYGIMENGHFYYFGADGQKQVEKDLNEDGWFQIADKWYYAKDGDLAKSQFITDGNYTYYVGYEGSMYKDRHFSIYDFETETDYNYYVDKYGHLLTGWYQDKEDKTWYYYGKDGRGANGITTIKGVTYYFRDSEMLTEYSFAENGYLYYFDADGVMKVKRSFDEDGWVQIGSDWYYIQNKDVLRNKLLESGKYTYYFDNSGKMVSNTQEWISGYYCRFNKDGHLVTGWYQDKEDQNAWYYYDSKGHAVSGFQEINGVTYYFDYGRMKTGFAFTQDGYFYYFDANGAQKVKKSLGKDGWIKIENNWYYIVDKQLAKDRFIKLGDYTYYFNYEGVMYADMMFGLPDPETRKTVMYYADSEGHLITGWFKWYGYNYYFGSDGRAADGITEIDGKTYYFKNHDLQKNCAIVENGSFYYFDKDGALETKTDISNDGWVSSSDNWFYVKSGNIIKNQFIKLGKYTYYVDYEGVMYRNRCMTIWDENDASQTYRFDADGHMVTGWYQDGLTWYYYNSDGTSVSGVKTINGKIYYFNASGQMTVNRIIQLNGKLYYISGDGTATPQSDNGWICDKYYVENGKLVTGWKKLDDKWYYFSEKTGEKFVNSIRNVGNEKYYFDTDGVMKTGWIKAGLNYVFAESSGKLKRNVWMKTGSKWYYFDENACMVDGIIKIGDAYHIFNADGTWNKQLVVKSDGWAKAGTKWYYFQNNKPVIDRVVKINGKQYRFDENGVMLTNTGEDGYYYDASGAALQNQWREVEPGRTEYYGADGKQVYEGWASVSGKWYYLRDGYRLTADDAVDGKLYHFAADGKSDGKGTALSNGWNLISGHYYYYKNGKILKSRQTIDGKKYFFDNNGQMEMDICISFGSSNERYRIQEDGTILTGGWSADHKYYADADGVLATGMQTIDGKTYMFAEWGIVRSHETIMSDDRKTIYKTDADGAISSTISKPDQTGWVEDSGNWYFVKKGVFMCDQVLYLNGKTYYLNSNGIMMTNGHRDGVGYAGSDGVIRTNGWYGDNTCYYENGEYVTGARTIDGKKYFFDGSGDNVTGLCYVDGTYYLYDGKGSRTAKKAVVGWNKYNNIWYYVESEGIMAEGAKKIDGKYYYFANGTMLVDQFVYDHDGSMYFDENGVLFTDGWKQIYGRTYYFDKNGRAYTGKRYIDGKWYVFTREGSLSEEK